MKFAPFWKQDQAYNFTTQIGLAVAGVQSGKTFLGAHWAIKKMGEFPDKSAIIAAPTYKILQSATLKKLFDICPELRKYYKEQKNEIVLPTGAIIYARSMDAPLGAEGITAHWIWYDEGGQGSRLSHTVLRSRVSMTGGQILITTTPYNLGALYQDYYLPWKEGRDKEISFFTWKSIENPYFSKEFYEAEQHRLLPEEFSRRYMGEFNKMVGLVWDMPESQIIAPIPNLMGKAEARIIGVDWGFRNPAAISVLYLYDKVWYLVDEWKQAEKTTAEIIQVLQNKIREHRITKVFPDPAEPDRLEECRRAGIPIYDTNKDVTGGLSFIKQLIYEKRFFVYNLCRETLEEMTTYHYLEADDGKAFKEEPEKFNDHLCDALRYALYSYHPLSINMGKQTAPLQGYYPEISL